MRTILGSILGFGVSHYFYGAPQPKRNEEIASKQGLAEALEDKDSLQYADLLHKRAHKTEIEFLKPGKIKD